jgi:penicillin G amidase
VGKTHRGPLITSDLVSEANILFGGGIPKTVSNKTFSLGWGFNLKPGDDYVKMLNKLRKNITIKELTEWLDTLEGGWNGVPQNFLFADTDGDIAYYMLCPTPIRKDKTPFIGSRILDGTTSEFDWEGLVPAKELPRSINPERGYIVTANNRQVPENSLYDYGANNLPTGRSSRIDEMIRNQIKSGDKISLADLGKIQQDVTDVYAREMCPLIV